MMTKALCLAIGLYLFVSTGSAQSHLGIEGQLAASNLPGYAGSISALKMNPLPAAGGGLWADIRLSDYMNFQPSLLFSPKGALFKEKPSRVDVHLNYLELPLLLLYRIPCGYDDFFLGGGVYGARGLQGAYRTPWDAGYAACASYQFSFGATLRLRYERGLVNIAPPGGGWMENQSLGLGLGFLFHYNTRD